MFHGWGWAVRCSAWLAAAVAVAGVLAGTTAAHEASGMPRVRPAQGASMSNVPAGLTAAVSALATWQRSGRAAVGGQFGLAVAVSGSTAVVGAPLRKKQAGAAYVFVRSGAKWSLQAVLTPSRPATGEQFGGAVAISGRTVVVGASWEDLAGVGRAYVFVRRNGRWTQRAQLTARHGAYGSGFGVTVAVSGSTVVVGSPYRKGEKGAAYVFVRSRNGWVQGTQLTPSPVAFDLFGDSVAVSDSTAIVGAEGWRSGRGTAFVFTRHGVHWSQSARLTVSGLVADDAFGYSVAMSGSTAVIGVDGWNIDRGEALVFTRTGMHWSQQATLTPSGSLPADSNFGFAVAVSGPRCVVGTFGPGQAYVFARSGTTWSQQAMLARGGTNDLFGASVAASGRTVVIGAPDTHGGAGAAYVYTGNSTAISL